MVSNGSVKVMFVTLQYTQQPFAVFSRKCPRVFDSSTFDTRDPQRYSLKPRRRFARGVRSDISHWLLGVRFIRFDFPHNVCAITDSCGLFIYLNIYINIYVI